MNKRAVVESIHPEYEKLPSEVKAQVTAKEYMWLTDLKRHTLVREMCEPDIDEGDI